ncbi:ATP-binding protein [Hydrogenophaga sp.]|uniref:hybrid sensor histidine kinase/response regulator n=1 Tax=Hydrogenophaga sp. TaxID=1904254 RepID=UPI00356A6004
MNPSQTAIPFVAPGVHAVLLVDDEPQACKWFARLYGDEFVVLTAGGVDEALDLLAQRGREVAVLLTDYRMPERDGVALLSEVRKRHSHVTRVLVSAYADKDVAMMAINLGHVEKILEKPLDETTTRETLREALATSRQRVRDQALLDRRASTLHETLGFLAHEVATPLATVRGYLSAMRGRHRDVPTGQEGMAHIAQQKPGDVLFMLEAAQRRADYAQSLVSTFVQTTRDAYRSGESAALRASDLVRTMQSEYPFDRGEAQWLVCDLKDDFGLPNRQDLLYLVLCALVKNALQALRSDLPARPNVWITLERAAVAPGQTQHPAIRVSDNGPGIAPHVLKRLTREPVSTRSEAGGGGMGLLFCRRVMASLGGSVDVRSAQGQGTTVTLFFAHPEESQNRRAS